MQCEDGTAGFHAAATGGLGIALDVEAMGFGFGLVLTCRDVRALVAELNAALHGEELNDEPTC